MTDLEERIREVMAATGWKTDTQIANAAGVSRSAAAQWLGKSSRPVLTLRLGPALRLEAATGFSARWIATGEGPKMRTNHTPKQASQPHAVSLGAFMVPPLISQEELMVVRSELPPLFRVAMPDDALQETTPRGIELIMESGAEPTPGQVVLVEDASGRRYVRRYGEGAKGEWRALASNPAYRHMESSQDGLKLLAVLRWLSGSSH
jgi:hypothetical protein